MEPSLFHFYSFGEVSANKPLYDKDGNVCDMVEVYPKEVFTMSTGENTDNVTSVEVKGKDASGKDYQSTLQTKVSLTCKWLPIHDPNRITPPDVRRGEHVMIYRYADTEFYFWSTAFNNMIRKLETAVWWFSGTPVEGKSADTKRDADNGYFLEISTHEKHTIFSTSNANGEVARYYIQVDGGNGNLIIKDDLGQEIIFESTEGRIEVTSTEQIKHKTKDYLIECETYTLNCKTAVINATDSMSITTPTYKVTASGSVTYDTPLANWSGDGKFDGDVTAGNISLRNHKHQAQGATAITSPSRP